MLIYWWVYISWFHIMPYYAVIYILESRIGLQFFFLAKSSTRP